MTSLVVLNLIIKITFNQKSPLKKAINYGKLNIVALPLRFFMVHPISCLTTSIWLFH